MSERKLLFIFNPKSGMGLIKNHLVDIVDLMIKAGFETTIYTTQEQGDATRKIIECGEDYDRIICSGGDGTLDEVVTGMRQKHLHIPLGYIPAGSTNDFAKSLGIPHDMVKAAQIAVGDTMFSCDVGQFNDDTFVYIAGFGLFTKISYETPQSLKNILGHAAYLLSAAQSLASIPNHMLQIKLNDEVIEGRFIYGMVTNSISVGGFKGLTGKDIRLDDGEFEVTLIKYPTNPIELNEIIAYLTGILSDSHMVYSRKSKNIHIRSRESVPWTLDGEFGGEHWDVAITNHQRKVKFLVDARSHAVFSEIEQDNNDKDNE